MTKLQISAGFMAMALLGSAQATNNWANSSVNSNGTIGSSNISLNVSSNGTPVPNGIVSETSLPPGSLALTGGFDGSASASSIGYTVASSAYASKSNLQQLVTFQNGGASSNASFWDSINLSGTGKIRFSLSYNLSAFGPNASTNLNLSGNVRNGWGYEGFGYNDSASNWGRGSISKSGVWTSDWYDYDSQSTWGETFYASLSINSSTSFSSWVPTSAQANGTNGWASFSYDVIPTATAIAPVPEPETYAMMLVGLGIIGAASRRRRS